MMIERLKKGEIIRIRPKRDDDGGEWVLGSVALASGTNPSSVALMLEGPLCVGGCGVWLGGGVPLMIDYEAETVKDLIGNEYELQVAGEPEEERGEPLHGEPYQ